MYSKILPTLPEFNPVYFKRTRPATSFVGFATATAERRIISMLVVPTDTQNIQANTLQVEEAVAL